MSYFILSLGLKTLGFFGYYYFHCGRDQMSHFNNEKLLEIFFAMEVLGMFLPYLKRYFQSHQRRFSPLVLKILGFFHFC